MQNIKRILMILGLAIVAAVISNQLHEPHLKWFHKTPQAVPVAKADPAAEIEYVAQPVTEPALVELNQLLKLQEADQVLLIDARTPAEFNKEHLPGAINLDYESYPSLDGLQKVAEGRTLVTYCDGDPCTLSTDLAMLMYQNDFDGVLIFYGGLEQWKKAGHPVVSGGTDHE